MRFLFSFIFLYLLSSVAPFSMEGDKSVFVPNFVKMNPLKDSYYVIVHNHDECLESIKSCVGYLTEDQKEHTIMLHDLDNTHVHTPLFTNRLMMDQQVKNVVLLNLLHLIMDHVGEWQTFLKEQCRHTLGKERLTSPIDLDGSKAIADYVSDQGIPQMIITRSTCLKDWRHYEKIHQEELFHKGRGINFSEENHKIARQNSKIKFPDPKKTVHQHEEGYHKVCYQNGDYGPCLMLSELDKGPIFDTLLFYFPSHRPKVVIVYDDNWDQLVSIAQELEKNNIKTICIFNNYGITEEHHLNTFIRRVFPSVQEVPQCMNGSPYIKESITLDENKMKSIDEMLSTYCEEGSNTQGRCPTHGPMCFREGSVKYWIEEINPQCSNK